MTGGLLFYDSGIALADSHRFAMEFAGASWRLPGGDCLVAMSATGESCSLLCELGAGRAHGLCRVALLGRDSVRAPALADVPVVVPHRDPARLQEAHAFIGNTWCGQIEYALGAH
jgi:hypothetical protein